MYVCVCACIYIYICIHICVGEYDHMYAYLYVNLIHSSVDQDRLCIFRQLTLYLIHREEQSRIEYI